MAVSPVDLDIARHDIAQRELCGNRAQLFHQALRSGALLGVNGEEDLVW
ncbi:hypothetical protein [Mycolicibacterium gadium]|nr:hypothetical protein [Mycolicibacterium gadium]